jgi:chromosome segregation protein
MRLSTLEIKGFKSFADRTVVNFSEDVIGVVGPNGCGKSNIVDSIRWVLGEQKSKELRLDKMTSVIFNGSKKRKPSGVAEVSLTFDNTKNILPTEYSNVKITRILYRNGDSEYRINGVKCRLKDIKNLFLDTGIGSNSYAIIALGMVDDLLTDRENSRRRLFEQAAGISKYKIRKKETLLRLKSASEDLERVEDLLFEIEGNLKKLEKQAKRAQKFLEIKASYKEFSLELAIYQLSDHKARYKKIKANLEKEQDNLKQIETLVHQKEAALEASKKANIDNEKKLSNEQRKLNSIVGALRGKENDKRLFHQKVNYIEERKRTLTQNIKESNERVTNSQEELEYYRGEINVEKDVEETLDTQLENAKLTLSEIRTKHQSVKKELDDYLTNQRIIDRDIFSFEKQQAVNTSKVENLQREMERSRNEIQRRQTELGLLKTQVDENTKRQSAKETLIQELELAEETLNQNIESTQKSIQESKDERVKVNRKLDSSRNEYNLTKSLVENLEGFPESIKYLSKNKKWTAQAPLLSDLIYCKEEYRIAIETYLEPYLNYYVVHNTEEAFQAIRLLSNAKKGKANFFLLDIFESQKVINPVLIDNSLAASDVIEVDSKYDKLVNHLLGNVLIQKEENEIQLESVANNPEVILLSQKGQFVSRRFSISGGSLDAFQGKRIGRKKNLEILKIQIEELSAKSDVLKKSIVEQERQLVLYRHSTKKKQIKHEQHLLNQLTKQSISLQTRMENFQTFLDEVTKSQAFKQEQVEKTLDKNLALSSQLGEKRVEANRLKANISTKDSSYKRIADELSRASEDYNSKNIQFIRQQNKINALQKEINFRKKQLTELDAKLEIDKRHLKTADKELDEVTNQIQELEEALVSLYEQRSSQKTFLNQAEELYYSSRGGITDFENELRQLTRKLQNNQYLISELKDKFNGIKLELSGISERLRIEFGVSSDELLNREPNAAFNQQELQDKVGRLKKRIENYGEINQMAIEAYKELKERYDFITAQRNDLLQAKESLIETIKEIETIATQQFLEAFESVRENFKKVFRSLFLENDDCDLMLEDPNSPLESRIKIMAKPKGKRPQSINSLSGGEKTLTATALLFALYLLKPAPFCIFDEVDAPLDDANISKFNRIIKEFSADSQFIIVTHNKQTMAAVDIIYGVTNTDGVSQVVPVDFRSLA